MKHINVYGPAARGKTRNAEMLRKKFSVLGVLDEGASTWQEKLIRERRFAKSKYVILTQQPIDHPDVTTISIQEALR